MTIIKEELRPFWIEVSHYYENLWDIFMEFQSRMIKEIERLEQESFSSSCRSPHLLRSAAFDRLRKVEINKQIKILEDNFSRSERETPPRAFRGLIFWLKAVGNEGIRKNISEIEDFLFSFAFSPEYTRPENVEKFMKGEINFSK